MTTSNVRELLRQKKNEAFVMWVDAMRLRGSVHDLSLDRITEEEWKEYEKPTAGFFRMEDL